MKTKIILIICFFSSLICFIPANGQMVVEEEASVIAQNWINIIIDQYGSWGNFDKATPGDIQKLERDGKPLGFYCQIKPEGFIVMSLRKELAPVKAYSAKSNINKNLEEGISLLIKDCMEGIINKIENQYESIETVQTKDLIEILEINYSDTWQMVYTYTSGAFLLKNPKGSGKDNYQEGDVLLTSDWHQTEPYNDQCPDFACTWPCNSNTNAMVGCVATAGAQIAHYWNWPPYGEESPYNDTYDWVNMPDDFTGCTWTAAQEDAVAELSHEVGIAVNMNYGCGSSGIPYPGSAIEDMFEDHFRYSTSCYKIFRDDYDPIPWFEIIKDQINKNRPIQYIIPGHSIVGDGWRETGYPIVREYHMNYGGDGSGDDIWYTLDALFGGYPEEELMFIDIFPTTSLGANLSGFYIPQSFPYRYFDQDASGAFATFYWGQWLQTLPGVKITGIGSSTYVEFIELTSASIRIFTGGNETEGIVINHVSNRWKNNGSIKLSEP